MHPIQVLGVYAGLGVEKHHLPEESVRLIHVEKDLLEALGFEKEEPEEHDQILEETVASDDNEDDQSKPTYSAAAAKNSSAKQV
jgi:hypothetical protein